MGGKEVQRKQRITFVEIVESQMLPNDGNNLKKLFREFGTNKCASSMYIYIIK